MPILSDYQLYQSQVMKKQITCKIFVLCFLISISSVLKDMLSILMLSQKTAWRVLEVNSLRPHAYLRTQKSHSLRFKDYY